MSPNYWVDMLAYLHVTTITATTGGHGQETGRGWRNSALLQYNCHVPSLWRGGSLDTRHWTPVPALHHAFNLPRFLEFDDWQFPGKSLAVYLLTAHSTYPDVIDKTDCPADCSCLEHVDHLLSCTGTSQLWLWIGWASTNQLSWLQHVQTCPDARMTRYCKTFPNHSVL